MPVPAAYAKLREMQEKTAESDRRRAEAERERMRQEETEVFRKLDKALKEYNGATLDTIKGYEDTIGIRKPAGEAALEVSRNGEKWMRFEVTWQSSACHCDGPCNCPVNRWCMVKPKKWFDREWKDFYFSVQDWADEEAVAKAFNEALREEHTREEYAPKPREKRPTRKQMRGAL